MKVIIAGSRTFDNYKLLCNVCNRLFQNKKDIEIISGCAKGADLLGEKYAIDNFFSIKRFPADWDTYGKSAGYVRNEEMAKYSDWLIAFWDYQSKGTKHMIDLANKYSLRINVVLYKEVK